METQSRWRFHSFICSLHINFLLVRFVSEELILFGFVALDSRMLWMMLEHNEEEMS